MDVTPPQDMNTVEHNLSLTSKHEDWIQNIIKFTSVELSV